MNDKVYDLLMKLPKKNIINVMWTALDKMQSYSDNTRTSCILESLGIYLIEEDNNGFHWHKWRDDEMVYR